MGTVRFLGAPTSVRGVWYSFKKIYALNVSVPSFLQQLSMWWQCMCSMSHLCSLHFKTMVWLQLCSKLWWSKRSVLHYCFWNMYLFKNLKKKVKYKMFLIISSSRFQLHEKFSHHCQVCSAHCVWILEDFKHSWVASPLTSCSEFCCLQTTCRQWDVEEHQKALVGCRVQKNSIFQFVLRESCIQDALAWK